MGDKFGRIGTIGFATLWAIIGGGVALVDSSHGGKEQRVLGGGSLGCVQRWFEGKTECCADVDFIYESLGSPTESGESK